PWSTLWVTSRLDFPAVSINGRTSLQNGNRGCPAMVSDLPTSSASIQFSALLRSVSAAYYTKITGTLILERRASGPARDMQSQAGFSRGTMMEAGIYPFLN